MANSNFGGQAVCKQRPPAMPIGSDTDPREITHTATDQSLPVRYAESAPAIDHGARTSFRSGWLWAERTEARFLASHEIADSRAGNASPACSAQGQARFGVSFAHCTLFCTHVPDKPSANVMLLLNVPVLADASVREAVPTCVRVVGIAAHVGQKP